MLEGITKAEYQKTDRHIALQHYAEHYADAGVKTPDNINPQIIKIRGWIEPAGESTHYNRITKEGIEKLQQYDAERALMHLFTQNPVVHGLDIKKSRGYANTIRVLNAVAEQSGITTKDIIDAFQIKESSVHHILSKLSSPENGFMTSTGKGVTGDPKIHMVTERGKLLLEYTRPLLAEMGENIQFKPRADERDANGEIIEGQRGFRFLPGVYNVKRILSALEEWQDSQPLMVEDLVTLLGLSDNSDVNKALLFMFRQEYVDRSRSSHGSTQGRPSYLYSLTEKGRQFLDLLKKRDEQRENLIEQLKLENITGSLTPAIKILTLLENKAHECSREYIHEEAGWKGVPDGVFLHLENLSPQLLISTRDPTSTAKNPSVLRKLYTLSDYARDKILPLIHEYQAIEFNLVENHMRTWVDKDGLPVKFY